MTQLPIKEILSFDDYVPDIAELEQAMVREFIEEEMAKMKAERESHLYNGMNVDTSP